MRLLHSIHRAHQTGSELFAKKLNGADEAITIRQAVLLDAIKENPGGTQTALVNATGIDRSTLADIAKRAMRKGWITRSRVPEDTRAYAVQITDEGKRMLSMAKGAAKKAEAELVTKMPQVKHLSAAA